MWFLRFDHGVTSVGMVLSTAEAGVSPEEEWSRVLGRYPSVAAQLEAAVPTRPLVRTGLLQRRLRPAAGPDWALLPAAAYFVDPFLSPGNAHGLFGIERIARAFERWPDDAEVARGLEEYDVALQREIDFLDALIHGSYRAFPSWPVLCAYTMYYFAGAICSEVRRERGEARPEDGFLFSHDDTFRELVHAAHRDVCALMAEGAPDGDSVEAFVERVRSDIEPFNLAGLCDPARTNLYPYV